MILKNPRVVGSVGIALNYQSTGEKFAARRMTSKNSKTLQFSLIRTINREPRLLLLPCYYLERIVKISDTGCFGCCSLVLSTKLKA